MQHRRHCRSKPRVSRHFTMLTMLIAYLACSSYHFGTSFSFWLRCFTVSHFILQILKINTAWHGSRKDRNRTMHSLHGNGAPKGYSKGKGGKTSSAMSSSDKTDTQIFLESVQDAIPEQAKMRAQTTLVQSEWSVGVVYHQQLTSRGGVAVCPRDALPSVLARVGYSGHATGILLVQCPDELGMKSYPRELVTCSLLVPGLNGETSTVQSQRWLVQLGFGPKVMMVAEGTEIPMPVHMIKMVCKLSPLRGWASGFHPASVFMEQISTHINEAAVDSLLARDGGSCIFLCHESEYRTLLKASGINGAYFKVHRDDPSYFELDLFWLPEDMSVDECLNLARDDQALGLIEKGSNGRLAIRFESSAICASFAQAKGLPDTSHLGRFKITGVPLSAGLHGLAELLVSRKWKVDQIVFMDSKHAIFLASVRGQDDPLFWKSGGQPRQIRFKALNATARGMTKMAATAAQNRRFPCLTPQNQRRNNFVKNLIHDLDEPDESMCDQSALKRGPPGRTGETPDPKEPKPAEAKAAPPQ